VPKLRSGAKALGQASVGKLTESDLAYRKFQRKSIVSGREISKGERLEREDLLFLRGEGVGVSPMRVEEFIGRKVNRPLEAFEPLSFEDLEE
jgi:sialic acid synthase SpsE